MFWAPKPLSQIGAPCRARTNATTTQSVMHSLAGVVLAETLGPRNRQAATHVETLHAALAGKVLASNAAALVALIRVHAVLLRAARILVRAVRGAAVVAVTTRHAALTREVETHVEIV